MTRLTLCLLFWLCTIVAVTAAPPCYTVTDIGTATSGEPLFVNNWGQVAGSYSTDHRPYAGNLGLRGFIWTRGRRTDLGLPHGYSSVVVRGLNNRGQIAGNLDDTTDGAILNIVCHAFLWQHGTLRYLSAPDGDEVSKAKAINDKGEIVGIATAIGRPISDDPAQTQSHAFVYRNGQMINLGPGEADAINNRGQIAGETPGAVHTEAALWNKDKPTKLGLWGTAYAINERGQVLLQWNPVQPKLWKKWQSHFLPIPPGFVGISATAINNYGQIVGSASTEQNHWSAAKQRAILWQNGSVIKLNDFIPARSGWVLTSADSINDKGQIAGHGRFHGEARAFLLTPTRPGV